MAMDRSLPDASIERCKKATKDKACACNTKFTLTSGLDFAIKWRLISCLQILEILSTFIFVNDKPLGDYISQGSYPFETPFALECYNMRY